MPSRIETLLQYLEEQHEVLRRAVESVPPERRTVRTAPDRWTVAEILEHVSIVESRLQKLFASKVAEARATLGPEQAALPDLHPWDRTRVLDRSFQVSAGEAVRPTGALDPDTAWSAAEHAYQRFRESVRASDGVPLGRMVFPHPFFGPMNLYSWIEFVAGHEGRHAAQIREIARL